MLQQPHRIIISGGGTGGHVFPAIAIANALSKVLTKPDLLFVGAKGRMEMEQVPAAGYPIKGLWISGFQRRLTWKNLLFPIKLLASLWQAYRIIRRFRPQAVVGVGGYSSGPVLYVAAKSGIPSLIQEQNSYPGVTNRLLGRLVQKVCVAYEVAAKHFPAEKIVVTGNPVRQDISDLESKREAALKSFGLHPGKPVLLSLGGSLGARSINEAIKYKMELLKKEAGQLLWQTGARYYEEVAEAVAHAGMKNVYPYRFIDRMDYAYAAADVVIARAGAITLSELSVAGKAALLVPSPNVAEDHQTKNALALVEQGAAWLVRDEEAREQLMPEALKLLKDKTKCAQLQQAIRKFARPEADKQIAAEVLKLIKRNEMQP